MVPSSLLPAAPKSLGLFHADAKMQPPNTPYSDPYTVSPAPGVANLVWRI